MLIREARLAHGDPWLKKTIHGLLLAALMILIAIPMMVAAAVVPVITARAFLHNDLIINAVDNVAR
jgi:hypothetical protein